MIKQGIVNDSIVEKKFKILRTSIMLGNIPNREEVMQNYEEAAREVDKIRRGVYEELLASKLYTTATLDDEEERLTELIDLINNRVKERNEFIDDYIKITSNFLDDLPKVSMEEELPNLKERLDNIHEYLLNTHEIEELNRQLKEKKHELEIKYESKANNEIINSKLEDELIDEFNKIIASDEYYAKLNYTDIDQELIKINSAINDKKDVMNTFVSSFEALKNAGISGAEREEYLSYVADSRADYYTELEKMYMLNIYKMVLDKEIDYDRLYEKRINLDNLINERETNRRELNIMTRDTLSYFVNLCREQLSVIKSQKYNIENIDKLILEISDCETKLEKLEAASNREEIVKLLEEFSIDKPKIEKIELPNEEEIHDEIIKEEQIKIIPKAPNMVVRVSEPIKIDVKNASDMAKLVMKKVVIVLEPKKFNTKRDKLKEAELELQEEKEKEVKIPEGENFVDLDISNNTDNKYDDVFINFNDSKPLDIKLDTGDVKTDIKDIVEFNNDEPLSIPTEILIQEESKEKPLDLFSETDPFLDDNEFEKNSEKAPEIVDGMPVISNIGTVKPNNMLSQIDEAAKQNENIILPTMGLSNSSQVDVPIVSENYIQ